MPKILADFPVKGEAKSIKYDIENSGKTKTVSLILYDVEKIGTHIPLYPIGDFFVGEEIDLKGLSMKIISVDTECREIELS